MERYPPNQLDNYYRNHFRQNGNIDEHSVFSDLFNSCPRRISVLRGACHCGELISRNHCKLLWRIYLGQIRQKEHDACIHFRLDAGVCRVCGRFSPLGIFVVNALNGLCKSLFEPASKALLSDMTEEKQDCWFLIYGMQPLISALSSALCWVCTLVHHNLPLLFGARSDLWDVRCDPCHPI